MRSLEASTTYPVKFSTSVAPDATPTATAYADETSLGAMTVSAAAGVNEYSAAVVLPGNVTEGQVITVSINWAVGGESQSTARLLVGQVGLVEMVAEATSNALASDIAAQLIDGLASAEITARLPVTEEGEIRTLTRGDDYLAKHGRALKWDVSLPAIDTTGATCHFGGKCGSNSWQIEGTVTRVGDLVTMSFDLASLDTLSLEPGIYSWTVELRSADGERMTKLRGTVPLEDSYTVPA